MSRAFVKEDVDPPERSGRTRSASGLPPGAINYLTRAGAEHFENELEELRSSRTESAERIAEVERILASATIVEPPEDAQSIAFGAKVTVRNAAGELTSYHIVGADELGLYTDAVSWISPTAKALLAADLGDRVTIDGGGAVKIVTVDCRARPTTHD